MASGEQGTLGCAAVVPPVGGERAVRGVQPLRVNEGGSVAFEPSAPLTRCKGASGTVRSNSSVRFSEGGDVVSD